MLELFSRSKKIRFGRPFLGVGMKVPMVSPGVGYHLGWVYFEGVGPHPPGSYEAIISLKAYIFTKNVEMSSKENP